MMEDLRRNVEALQHVHLLSLAREASDEVFSTVAKIGTQSDAGNLMRRLVDSAADQLQSVVRKLSSVIGWTTPFVVTRLNSNQRTAVMAVLRLAANREQGMDIPTTSSDTFLWHRMPVWLRFTPYQREFFRYALDGDGHGILSRISTANTAESVEIFIANAFLESANRDWISAERNLREAIHLLGADGQSSLV